MAKGTKTGGRNFKPGNKAASGKGRPPLPPDLKEAKLLTNTAFMALVQRFLVMDWTTLQAHLQNPTTPMLEVIVGSIVAKAATGSDHARLDFLLQRLIGKVQEPPQQHQHFNFNMMPRAQVIAMGQEALAFLKRAEKEDE